MAVSLELVRSPWQNQLIELADSVCESLIIVAPYVTGVALFAVFDALRHRDRTKVSLTTTLSSDSVAHGSLDIASLTKAYDVLPEFRLNHVPRLHAKIYIADDKSAIVTSGNLTTASLLHNNEYGVRITDDELIREIKHDVGIYASLGSTVKRSTLDRLAAIAPSLMKDQSGLGDGTGGQPENPAEREFDDIVLATRGDRGEPRTTIFGRTILHILRSGPLMTKDIHEMVKDIHPDLCDDNLERMINGVSFGKRWKHDVRNAQLTLRRQGRVERRNEYWALSQSA